MGQAEGLDLILLKDFLTSILIILFDFKLENYSLHNSKIKIIKAGDGQIPKKEFALFDTPKGASPVKSPPLFLFLVKKSFASYFCDCSAILDLTALNFPARTPFHCVRGKFEVRKSNNS